MGRHDTCGHSLRCLLHSSGNVEPSPSRQNLIFEVPIRLPPGYCIVDWLTPRGQEVQNIFRGESSKDQLEISQMLTKLTEIQIQKNLDKDVFINKSN